MHPQPDEGRERSRDDGEPHATLDEVVANRTVVMVRGNSLVGLLQVLVWTPSQEPHERVPCRGKNDDGLAQERPDGLAVVPRGALHRYT